MRPTEPSTELPRTRVYHPRELALRGLSLDQADLPIDWSSWYLTDEEDMGQGGQHDQINDVLRSSLRRLAEERGWTRILAGVDQFFAWIEHEPLVRVSPDIFLLDDPPDTLPPSSWQTWRPDHRPPRFAVEVVSPKNKKKDYDDAPLKYDQLGTGELVIFDPEALLRSASPRRIPLQLYRRGPGGTFPRMYQGPGPVYSAELNAYLVARREGHLVRLRIARDADGLDLVPTEAEHGAAEEKARRRAEEARHQAEEARRQAEEARRQAEKHAAQEAEARRQAEVRASAAADRIRELEAILKVHEGQKPRS